jgi:DNA-binding response OmpR family regulator
MPRLLVIEDEADFRGFLVESLAAEGYEVDAAANGLEGLALARAHTPDLVLCDIGLGDIDGYGVLAALRADPASAVLPVIFLTGLGAPHTLREGMNLGADDYLAKPIHVDDLLRAVRARLGRHGDLRREVRRRVEGLRTDLAQQLPHEFLTPLTAVMGLSSLLMDDPGALDAEGVREVARGIFVGSRRLQQIIEKFLLYAELGETERGGGPAQPATLDESAVRRVVDEVVAARAAERAPDVQTWVGEGTRVGMSADELRAVVGELVENAVTCSPPGSKVSVRGHSEEGHWVLEVADAGRGMSAEQVRGLDENAPFHRRHEGQPGIGLGLAIVRRIADLRGAHLSFATAPGRGTTARLASRRPGVIAR